MITDRIKPGTYTGYIWRSDSDYPAVYEESQLPELIFDDQKNPFIIEAKMYDKSTGDSYSVRYIDGHHIASVVNVKELDGTRPRKVELDFIGNKMKDHDLVFNQYYCSVKDPLCEDMETLCEAECVFVGFKR